MAGRRSGHPDRAASQLPAQSRSPQKCGGDGRNRAGLFQPLTQAKLGERALTATADKFAADAMTRVISSLINRHGDILLSERYAERQPGQAAADNLNYFLSGHFNQNAGR